MQAVLPRLGLNHLKWTKTARMMPTKGYRWNDSKVSGSESDKFIFETYPKKGSYLRGLNCNKLKFTQFLPTISFLLIKEAPVLKEHANCCCTKVFICEGFRAISGSTYRSLSLGFSSYRFSFVWISDYALLVSMIGGIMCSPVLHLLNIVLDSYS